MIGRLETDIGTLARHLEILENAFEQGSIAIVKLANQTKYPHHKIL